jgi:hypothetical protein
MPVASQLTPQKEEIINKVYNDPGGFLSIKETYKDSKEKDSTITLNNVQTWFTKNVARQNNLRGYNTFVARSADQEIAVDLFFITDRYLKDQKYSIGMIAINAFTKKMTVVPLAKKDNAHLTAALLEIIQKQGVKPKAFYTDEESGLKSTELINYFRDKGIRFIFTRTHAGSAERGIRTFRDMLF